MARKGPSWERTVAKRLSLWWTEGERDDIFWRSTASGARATARGKKGKSTRNSCGDICALDPIGQPLLDLITIETKSGYNRSSIQDLLDKGPKAAKQTHQEWIEKAIRDHQQAGSFSWMVIFRRDRREPLVLLPQHLADVLGCGWCWTAKMVVDLGEGPLQAIVVPLELWLQAVKPKDAVHAAERMAKRRK